MAAFAGLESSRYLRIEIHLLRGPAPDEALNIPSFASKCDFTLGIFAQKFTPKKRPVRRGRLRWKIDPSPGDIWVLILYNAQQPDRRRLGCIDRLHRQSR